jgi:hypothetical protein
MTGYPVMKMNSWVAQTRVAQTRVAWASQPEPVFSRV